MGIVNAINQRDSTRCNLLQQIREPFFFTVQEHLK